MGVGGSEHQVVLIYFELWKIALKFFQDPVANSLGHKAQFSNAINNASVALWVGNNKGPGMKGVAIARDSLFGDSKAQHAYACGNVLNFFLPKPNKIHGRYALSRECLQLVLIV
jgi:hypothetical protein